MSHRAYGTAQKKSLLCCRGTGRLRILSYPSIAQFSWRYFPFSPAIVNFLRILFPFLNRQMRHKQKREQALGPETQKTFLYQTVHGHGFSFKSSTSSSDEHGVIKLYHLT